MSKMRIAINKTMEKENMICPECKEEMLEARPKVFYCQTSNCKITYIVLSDANVRIVDCHD